MSDMYKNMSSKMLHEIAATKYGVNSLTTTESAKARHSAEHGTLNTILYLAPWNLSGHQVCPGGEHCHKHCLNGSGLAKVELLAGKTTIQDARINRTNLFYDDRELFMEMLVREIRRDKRIARRRRMNYAVRLNGESDLHPRLFRYGGKSLPDYFHGTQFYDYTKVPHRLKEKMPANYDLTFSFDGYNSSDCVEYLSRGGRVAVVFSDNLHPKTFWGYPVVCGDNYDMRYMDPAGSVIGLTYHPTAVDYERGEDGRMHYMGAPDIPFVVKTHECEDFTAAV